MSAAAPSPDGQRVMDIGGVDVTESSTDGPPATAPMGDPSAAAAGGGVAPSFTARDHRPLQTREEARQAGVVYDQYCQSLAGMCGYRLGGGARCSQPAAGTSKLCTQHTCHNGGGCAAVIAAGKPFCEDHACAARVCQHPTESAGDEFCADCARRVRCWGLCKPVRTARRRQSKPTARVAPRPPDNPASGQPARDPSDAIKRHPRAGAKFVCLVPGHPRHGAVGTIHHVYEDDAPPRPPRLVVGVSWDNADNGGAAATSTANTATSPALEELVLEAGNHLTTPRCDGYNVGDGLAVEMVGRGEEKEFFAVSVIARVRHSRYRLKEGGPQSHHPEFELDVNAGNAYQPLLTQEVGAHRSVGRDSFMSAACDLVSERVHTYM